MHYNTRIEYKKTMSQAMYVGHSRGCQKQSASRTRKGGGASSELSLKSLAFWPLFCTKWRKIFQLQSTLMALPLDPAAGSDHIFP